MGLEVEVVGEANTFDIICVGGGIAGMVASSVCTQLGLKSCFLERDVPGGKLMQIPSIHNLEGYEGFDGATFATTFFKQVTEDVKTHYSFGNLVTMKEKNDKFYLFTEDGQTWECKALILCTGTVINRLKVPGAEKYNNHGLSYCIHCDGSLAKNKKVVLIGNSLHLDHLKQFTNDITIVDPFDVVEILGNDKQATGIKKADGSIVNADFIFVENGFKSDLSFLIPEVQRNQYNEVVVDDNMHTSFTGIFACGDCTNKGPKQIWNAIQQAQIAGQEATNYVKGRKW